MPRRPAGGNLGAIQEAASAAAAAAPAPPVEEFAPQRGRSSTRTTPARKGKPTARGGNPSRTEPGSYSDEYRAAFPQIDPTATSNPERPRTLEAGYDRNSQILRVRFRDGTPWEYLEVEPQIWQRFRRSASPGRFINRVLNNYPYRRGNF